ncbi:hypothetical protein QTP88_005627 [Uroleucon formosanum]
MGIYEEAKIRLNDIQNRINRVRAAGVALENEPTNKTSLTKFRMMYATVRRLQEEFEVQMSIIIKQIGKPEKEQKPEDKVYSPDELREKFEEESFKQLWEMKNAVFNDEKSIRQMLNHISESTGALKNLNYVTDLWDPILLHLIQQKLNGQLRAQWKLHVDTNMDMNNTHKPTVKFNSVRALHDFQEQVVLRYQ